MELSFNYTYDDYVECSRAVRKPIRRPGKRNWETPLMIAGTLVVVLTLMVVSALNSKELPDGTFESTFISRLAMSMASWLLVLGLLWGGLVPRMDPAARGTIRLAMLAAIAAMAASAVIMAATSPAIDPPRPETPERPLIIALAPWLVLFGGFYVVLLLIMRGLAKSMWFGQQQLHRPHTMRISEDGVEIETPVSRMTCRWESFILFRETKNLFVLQVGRMSFEMLPKRACRDGQEIEALRRLIERKVPSAQPTTTGFAVLPATPVAPSGVN